MRRPKIDPQREDEDYFSYLRRLQMLRGCDSVNNVDKFNADIIKQNLDCVINNIPLITPLRELNLLCHFDKVAKRELKKIARQKNENVDD